MAAGAVSAFVRVMLSILSASRKVQAMSEPSVERPFITVLMPVYNAQTYLQQAVDSVLGQSFADFELLCIDDGSSDDSPRLLAEYARRDPRVRVLTKANSGYGDSMNKGVEEARGTYIAILEPDDFFEPGALKLLVGAAQREDADIVKANYWFYWSKPEEKNQKIAVVKPDMAGHVFCAKDEPAILTSIPSIWSALYRRGFLIDSGVRLNPTPGASFQDMGFSFKVFASAQTIYCIEEPVLHYRQDNESSSVNNPAKTFCVCDEFESIDDYIAEGAGRAWLKPYKYRLMYDSYIWNFSRLSVGLRKAFLPRMVADLRKGRDEGAYRPELFEAYQAKNLEYLLGDPQAFFDQYPVNASQTAKARYYLRIGGFTALRSAIKH